MKTTRLVVTQKPVEEIKTDLLVFCTFEQKKEPPKCDSFIQEMINRAFHLGDFSGKINQEILFYPDCQDTKKKLNAKRILIVGLGKREDSQDRIEFYETLRLTGGRIAASCKKLKAGSMALSMPKVEGIGPDETAQSLAEGLLLGDYRFLKYKDSQKKDADYLGIKTIHFISSTNAAVIRRGAKKGQNSAQAACEARDMANEPGNGWTSKEFADYAKKLGAAHGFKYTCLEKKQLEKLGMGGILAVNQGSAIPPRMIVLEYRSKKAKETLLLVGKGITFDSGGVSLKPAAGMEEMKYDMCGGAAVLAAMDAVGKEKPDLNVVAIIPATDNMSGSSAIRPGDIIRHFNGVTAEIVNTDAEGRMILGDALSYGIKTFKPDGVIDAATLTGAVIIGLGHHHSGLMGNNDPFAEKVTAAGQISGEPVWQLPLTKEYKKQIKSDVADIKNIGGRPAGSITAAAYLSNFVGDTPWVHLDIAGTAWNFTKKSYIPKGPSGIGVRTFITLIREWENGILK